MRLPPEALERVTALLSAGRRQMLGITGPPGAGKSTVAAAIEQELSEQIVVVPMDGFHLSNLQLRTLGRSARKGAPDTFDVPGYVALLQRVRKQASNEVVYAPKFHRDIEESIAAEIAILPDVPLIITEGNYLLLEDGGWEQVRRLLDEVWFVDAPASERHARLVARHCSFGRTQEEAEAWVAHTDEPNAQIIGTGRARADFILES